MRFADLQAMRSLSAQAGACAEREAALIPAICRNFVLPNLQFGSGEYKHL
jgi:hypothetical protein